MLKFLFIFECLYGLLTFLCMCIFHCYSSALGETNTFDNVSLIFPYLPFLSANFSEFITGTEYVFLCKIYH